MVLQCPLGAAPGGQPPSLSVRDPSGRPGGPILRRALVSGAPGFVRARPNRCGAPSLAGRRRAGQCPSRFESPSPVRVVRAAGAPSLALRPWWALRPAGVRSASRRAGWFPLVPAVVVRLRSPLPSALCSVVRAGGFGLAGGPVASRLVVRCSSGCLPRSQFSAAPGPPARLAAAAPPLSLTGLTWLFCTPRECGKTGQGRYVAPQ